MTHRLPVSGLVKTGDLTSYDSAWHRTADAWFFGTTAAWSTNWPVAGVGSTSPTYRAVPTDYATIGDAAAAAAYGDIITLAAGTYVEDISIPLGVGIRPALCSDVIIQGYIELAGDNTLRHLTLESVDSGGTPIIDLTGSNYWFEDCTFLGTQTYSYSLLRDQANALNDVVFRRCSFHCAFTDSPLVAVNMTGYFEMSSCYINMALNSGAAVDITADGDVLFANNTLVGIATADIFVSLVAPFSNVEANSNIFIADTDIGGYACYVDSTSGSQDGNVLVNLLQDNANFNPTNATTATVVGLHMVDYPTIVSFRNESPVRYGQNNTGPLLDRAGHPFATLRTPGCYQWEEESSHIYRPRFDHDLVSATNLDFYYDLLLGLENSTASTPETYYSADQVACHVNLVIGDVAHPSRAVFYVDTTGQYRLLALENTFDLTLAGDSAIVFGAYSASGQTDTG